MFMLQQHVQPATHREIEWSDPAGPHKVELIHPVVTEVIGTQLSHVDPFEIRHQHPALGEVDTTNLFVIGSLPIGVVPVDCEHDRDLSRQLFRFVEQAGDKHPRDGLVAELADAILGASVFNRLEPLDLCRQLPPLGGLSTEDHFVECPRSPLGDESLPLLEVDVPRNARDASFAECLDFFQRRPRFQNRSGQCSCHLLPGREISADRGNTSQQYDNYAKNSAHQCPFRWFQAAADSTAAERVSEGSEGHSHWLGSLTVRRARGLRVAIPINHRAGIVSGTRSLDDNTAFKLPLRNPSRSRVTYRKPKDFK